MQLSANKYYDLKAFISNTSNTIANIIKKDKSNSGKLFLYSIAVTFITLNTVTIIYRNKLNR